MSGFFNEGKAQSGVDYQAGKKALNLPSVWVIFQGGDRKNSSTFSVIAG